MLFIQSTPPNKTSTGKKTAADENNKIDIATKTPSTKQQQAPARTENIEGKKQLKTAGASTKQQTSGKGRLLTNEFSIVQFFLSR